MLCCFVQTTPNGCSSKNFSSNHPWSKMASAAFKYIPQLAAMTCAFSSVWFLVYGNVPMSSCELPGRRRGGCEPCRSWRGTPGHPAWWGPQTWSPSARDASDNSTTGGNQLLQLQYATRISYMQVSFKNHAPQVSTKCISATRSSCMPFSHKKKLYSTRPQENQLYSTQS